ncbi:MAG: F0F1 ATP synthase subunit B [Candidatus Magasanikbacteria bacterium]|nr:F0F1 ATP synthase subunit B [Candidatus Magasanikbacteria bacterium]
MSNTDLNLGEATQDTSLAASLGLNTQLFLFQLLNFVLVAIIIWFLILKPLTKKLEERKKIIDESIDNAKKVETNLAMSQQKFDETIARAKHEANQIAQKAHDEAEQIGLEIKDRTKNEVAHLIDSAKKAIALEKEEMRLELRKETVDLVVLLTEKILGEKLDAKKNDHFIKEMLKNIKN